VPVTSTDEHQNGRDRTFIHQSLHVYIDPADFPIWSACPVPCSQRPTPSPG
jgi:hypothetical protein